MFLKRINNKITVQKNILRAVLLVIMVYGFYLRFQSTLFQASYWNDESHTALFSRSIMTGGFPTSPIGVDMGIYQIALYYITALSFKLFGITEFAGRLPSVLVGTVLIGVIFFVTRRMIGERAAVLAAFLMAFSQMQLAWSTQLRPYIWMELFTILVIYWSYEYLKSKKIITKALIYAGIVSVISLLFHGTGIYNFVILGSIFLYQIIRLRKWKYLLLLGGSGIAVLLIIAQTPFFVPSVLIRFNTYITHYQVYLTHHYLWLGAGGALGFAYLFWKGKRELVVLLAGSIAFIILFSLFKVHARYVRYSITAFPLLYILFSAGISGIIQIITAKLPQKIPSILITGIICAGALAIPIYKDKILLAPQRYYSINADMRENPIVDYKGAFTKIEKLIDGREDLIVMDAWNDRVPWYLPDQEFILLVKQGYGNIDPFYGERKIGTVEGFETVKSQYPAGIVIVENWQSMTPEDLQQHIRETLTFEFTQDTVEGNEDDPWSISVYSWGLD